MKLIRIILSVGALLYLFGSIVVVYFNSPDFSETVSDFFSSFHDEIPLTLKLLDLASRRSAVAPVQQIFLARRTIAIYSPILARAI
jgi:hypothetical protein